MSSNTRVTRTPPLRELRLPRTFQVILFFMLLSTGPVAFSRRNFEQIIHSDLMGRTHGMVIDGSGSITSAILLSIVAYLSYYRPIWSKPRVLTLSIYFIIMLVHTGLFTLLSMALRTLGFHIFNLSIPQQESFTELMQMEAPAQIFMLIVTISAMHGLYFFQYSASEKLRLTKVEHQLALERLHSLQSQLNPHFLFNTLNMISGVMYQDLVAADRMIEQLSDLLRASLTFGARAEAEVMISEELALLRAYTSIMQERFPDQFEVSIECSEELHEMKIPPLLLQPLIENSIKHGRFDMRRDTGQLGEIEVSIKLSGSLIEIQVLDNGGSSSVIESQQNQNQYQIPPTPLINKYEEFRDGVGLKLTRERLRLLYGKRSTFLAHHRNDSTGYRVLISFPFEHQLINDPPLGAVDKIPLSSFR